MFQTNVKVADACGNLDGGDCTAGSGRAWMARHQRGVEDRSPQSLGTAQALTIIRAMKRPLSLIPRWLGLALLYLYRALLSPLLTTLFGLACRFRPTCSEYAIEAVRRYGLVRGSLMAARRVARCHPLGGHGYDPVPVRPALLTRQVVGK
jgi:uncharacterized protein